MISRHAASNGFVMHQYPNMGRPRSSTPMIDKCAIVPMAACTFALIIFPLLIFVTFPQVNAMQSLLTELRLEDRIFWPAMAAISVVLAVRHRSRVTLAPHMISLLAYLCICWSKRPVRFRPG